MFGPLITLTFTGTMPVAPGSGAIVRDILPVAPVAVTIALGG
jgi:hypothetical protein